MNYKHLVLEKLIHSKDFDYLFNRKPFHCFGGKPLRRWYDDLESFVNEFCYMYPYFPASVVGTAGNNKQAPSMDEVNSVAHYIMDFAFIWACVDTFVEKAMSGPVLGKTDFETFTVTDKAEHLEGYTGVHFTMYSQEKDIKAVVVIRLPEFTVNKYETFDTITEFKNSTRIKMDIRSGAMNLADMHLAVGTSTLLSAFPHFLVDLLHEFVTRNKL